MTKPLIKQPSIFISIAAYRDKELIPTILDCIRKSERKNKLFFGICLQDTKEQYWKLKHIKKKYKLNMGIIFMDWKDSKGTCWARHLIQKKMFRNQKYYLQLDSHHRFIEQWDSVLLHLFESIKSNKHPKPIITGYCPAYSGNKCEEGSVQVCSFDTFDDDGDLVLKPLVLKDGLSNTTHIPARFLSGHFIFSDGSFCKDCLYDPNLYFRGEELSLSARAFTKGYDFFHPTFPILWHYYLRLAEPKHWDKHIINNGFINDTKSLDEKSKSRVRKLLGMEINNINFGQYGMGKERTLHQYELFVGLDFKNKKVHKYCANISHKYPLPFNMSEQEWSKHMLMKKLITIYFPELIIKHINSYVQEMSLRIFSNKNITLHETEITAKQLATIVKNNLQFKKTIGVEDIPAYGVLTPKYADTKLNKPIKLKNISYYDI